MKQVKLWSLLYVVICGIGGNTIFLYSHFIREEKLFFFLSSFFLILELCVLLALVDWARKEREQQRRRIVFLSETFLEKICNCIENAKKSLYLETISPSFYDEIEREGSAFFYQMDQAFPSLESEKKKQSYLHYLRNIRELSTYLLEVKKEWEEVREEEKKNEALLSYLKDEKTMHSVMENHIIFLEDYVDIFLLELFPFLEKKTQKNFVQYCKKIQEKE